VPSSGLTTKSTNSKSRSNMIEARAFPFSSNEESRVAARLVIADVTLFANGLSSLDRRQASSIAISKY
jgi:hypothetical protein